MSFRKGAKKVAKKTSEVAQSMDNFSSEFKLGVKDGEDSYKTLSGSMLSIISLVFVIYYAYLKYHIMDGRKDTQFMESVQEDYYNDTYVETDKYNFNVAFGVTEYDGTSTFIEDEDYATMKAYYREWGTGIKGVKVTEVPIRRCTMADFGLDEDGNQIDDGVKTALTEEE